MAAKYSLFDIIKNNRDHENIFHLFMNNIIKEEQEEIAFIMELNEPMR